MIISVYKFIQTARAWQVFHVSGGMDLHFIM